MLVAEIIVYLSFAYIALGALFAVWFVFFGAEKIDDAARESGLGFKIVIFVGAAALWIVLLSRLFGLKK